jgi:general secretion pathway protein G
MHCAIHLRNRVASADRGAIKAVKVFFALAVAAILLILIIPKLDRSRMPPAVREVATITQIQVFKTALDGFQIDNGFYPSGTNGLLDLIRQPVGTANWHGPYIKRIPKDPWEREYIYECPGKHTTSGYPYDLFSLGRPGKHDPIANWRLGMEPL